jgi:hypothetical protein
MSLNVSTLSNWDLRENLKFDFPCSSYSTRRNSLNPVRQYSGIVMFIEIRLK